MCWISGIAAQAIAAAGGSCSVRYLNLKTHNPRVHPAGRWKKNVHVLQIQGKNGRRIFH